MAANINGGDDGADTSRTVVWFVGRIYVPILYWYISFTVYKLSFHEWLHKEHISGIMKISRLPVPYY